MSHLTATDTRLSGLKVIERQQMRDERGYFARLFCADALAMAGWQSGIAQINESWTARRGTVRGMHYQAPPFADAKLVTCVQGAVHDVALDVRSGSPTFLQSHAELLSAENGRALMLPPGCAHGFQALTDDVLLIYCHSIPYTPAADQGINPTDPRIAVSWPLQIDTISERDRSRALLTESFSGVQI